MKNLRHYRRSRFIGLAIAILARLAGNRRLRYKHLSGRLYQNHLKTHHLPISTQRIGLRFSDNIRDVFRSRWVRRK